MEHEINENVVFSKNVVEFVTVANEFCKMVENPSFSQADSLVDVMRKILPLLYLKASLVPEIHPHLDEELEKFVTEYDYNVLSQKWIQILGENDLFHEVFDPEIQFGTEPVTASISENILDIYQDLKDFLLSYRTGESEVMNDSLAECMNHFWDFWGQRLVNVLRALHQLAAAGVREDTDKRGSRGK